MLSTPTGPFGARNPIDWSRALALLPSLSTFVVLTQYQGSVGEDEGAGNLRSVEQNPFGGSQSLRRNWPHFARSGMKADAYCFFACTHLFGTEGFGFGSLNLIQVTKEPPCPCVHGYPTCRFDII